MPKDGHETLLWSAVAGRRGRPSRSAHQDLLVVRLRGSARAKAPTAALPGPCHCCRPRKGSTSGAASSWSPPVDDWNLLTCNARRPKTDTHVGRPCAGQRETRHLGVLRPAAPSGTGTSESEPPVRGLSAPAPPSP